MFKYYIILYLWGGVPIFEGLNLVGYYAMYLVGTILMFTVSLATYKKYELKIWQAIVFTLVALCGGLAGTVVMGNVYTAVLRANGLSGESNMAIYGAVMFTPIILLAVCLISRQPWKKIIDMIAPSGIIFTACAKLGCMFIGCCNGIECSFGVYSYRLETKVFPSPVFEFITMLIIIVLGFRYAFKSKKYVPGSVYPVMGILYGGTRFFWEFLRYYKHEIERHIIMGMTLWQFCSVLTVTISVIWLVLLNKDKIEALIEQKKAEKAEEERKARAQAKRYGQKKKKKARK